MTGPGSDETASGATPVSGSSAPASRTAQDLVGKITRLRVDQRGKDVVLYGVLETESNGTVTVAMRGQEVRGIVEVGDRVRLHDGRPAGNDEPVQATRLDNLTTDSAVSVWGPPLSRRLGQLAGPTLVSAVVGPLVGALVGALLTGSGSASRPRSPSSTAGVILVAAILGLIVALGIFYFSYIKPRRRRRSAFIASARSQGRSDHPRAES
jgi:hypothetical protein